MNAKSIRNAARKIERRLLKKPALPVIRRMSLKPGDVVVMSVPNLTAAMAKGIIANVKKILPGAKVLVKGADIKMSILRKGAKK